MLDGTVHLLDVNSVWFCLGNQCTNTLRVDRQDGTRFDFTVSEVDYIDGPSTKVVWSSDLCQDPTMRRDKFFVKTRYCEDPTPCENPPCDTSGNYVYYNCNINLTRENLMIWGAESHSDQQLKLELVNIELVDFPP
jgi:hypothetical protein